jgi:hypothetical protein
MHSGEVVDFLVRLPTHHVVFFCLLQHELFKDTGWLP